MHSFMFLSLVNTSLGRSALFGIALASATLLGVVRQGSFSFHIFPGVSITVGYLPYWGFLFCKVSLPTPWPFRKIFEDSALSLGVPCSFLMAPTFSERVPKWYGETCRCFPCDLVWDFVPIFCWYPSCCWISSLLQLCCPCGGLMGFSSLFSLWKRGSKITRETSPRLREISWEVFSMPYCFVFMRQQSSRWDIFPALWRDFFYSRVSSCSVRKRG